MENSHVEIEDKFDVDPSFVVPDLAPLLPPETRVTTSSEQLRSSYFDTAGHDLLRAQMTLRRRTGTTDTGWQLKVPHKPAREEIRLPGLGKAVPKRLEQLLLGVTRGQPLRPVATVTTERSVHRYVDVDGNTLAEIDDDTVHASVGGAAATIMTWREVEVELRDGDQSLLKALGKRLRKAGAAPAASASKLARVLTHASPSEGAPAAGDPPPAADGSAAGPLIAYLSEQHRVLLAGDLALRRDIDEVIHKTRVAARRLRSTLRTFRVLFDPDSATDLDAELRWFAGLLGEVRDRQVLRARLQRLVDELPDELVWGPVRARIDTELRQEQTRHWRRLKAAMAAPRYLALLDSLAAWTSAPPLTRQAGKPVSTLARMVEHTERKVYRRLAEANETGDVDLLHRARKAAKRARYAAELAEPVTGGKVARRIARRYQRLQDLLGEHQDIQVSTELLRRLGAKAGTALDENGFTFGLLYEREQDNAKSVREQARRVAAAHG